MTHKLFIFVFLITVEFCYPQKEIRTFQGYSLWPKKTHMLEMKEIKATFNKEFLHDFKESMSKEQEEQKASEEMSQTHSKEEQMKTNRIRRAIESEENSMSSVNESSNSVEVQNPKPGQVGSSKQATKRQTSIIGNGNRLSNLINLPVRLNVLANVLSKLNQGVLDTKAKPLGSTTIKGNDNTISSLVNAPIDADAVVNLLSKVDRTKAGTGIGTGAGAGAASQGGVVDGLLGGLLGGGASGKGNKGLVGGLLDGVLGDGLLGDLLGDTLGDLLGALLGSDGLVGSLLGGVDGKGLVTDLLHNLLGGVVDLVENLLELLVGILDGLLVGLAGSDAAAAHSAVSSHNNQVSSLVNAPARVEALINALTSLKKELRQQLDPAAAPSQGINIQGNNNQASSLINLPIDLNLDLNLLSSTNTTVLGGHQGAEPSESSSSGSSSPGSSLLGSLLGSSSPGTSSSGSSVPETSLLGSLLAPSPPASSTSGSLSPGAPSSSAFGSTNIQGNNNTISSLLNVVPDVNLNLNILSEITDLLVGHGGSSSGTDHETNPNEICFDVPITKEDTSITGDNNKISSAINVKPKINIDLSLLGKVKETNASDGPTQRVCITRPSQPLAPRTERPVTKATKPSNELCFNVLGERICIPRSTTAAPAPIFAPTVRPLNPPSYKRCFRRTCTKWRQFMDYECLNDPKEYPKYTFTRDI